MEKCVFNSLTGFLTRWSYLIRGNKGLGKGTGRKMPEFLNKMYDCLDGGNKIFLNKSITHP